jgi:hypothetical protein
MRAEAVAAFVAAGGELGKQVRRILADVARIGSEVEAGEARPVLLAIAEVDAVRTALKPLTDAGIRITSVVTPALALLSLARLRRQPQDPSSAEAYVVVGETATCMAAVRGGVLLAARELPWGYLNGGSTEGNPPEVISRLGNELASFFAATPTVKVSHICLSGSIPKLRTMIAPLMERFDVEVEPLDTMFGIDVASMPEPSRQFRERIAEMRLTWAVAADNDSPLNLFRQVHRDRATKVLARAAAANFAAGIGAAWQTIRTGLPAAAHLMTVPQLIVSRRVAPPAKPRIPEAAGPVVADVDPTPAGDPPDPVAPRALPDQEPPPFDAVLGKIIGGPERRLAIIDGRLVLPGDHVKGACVIDITATHVLLRDALGHERSLTLAGR